MNIQIVVYLWLSCLLTLPVHAELPPLDVPIVDTPFNFSRGTYVFPSMRQSLALSTDFYEGMHAVIGGNPFKREEHWRYWAIAGFDALTAWTPLGESWVHEEWHRAVMNRHGIASYDDINDFPIGRSLISVSGEDDADLVRLKRDHPADMVRLSAAGMEANTAQNLLFDEHHFFDDLKTRDNIAMFVNAATVSFYLYKCGNTGADSATDSQNNADGADISKRDFTGLDCTGWIYDLSRPDEPYTARGVHPSGVGIDRYIRYSDLTGHEQGFLRRQIWLSAFNFVDPMMFGFAHFHTSVAGEDAEWNVRTAHFLTSFGYTVDANFYFRQGARKFLFTVHNGFNDKTYFPGVTLKWLDHPLFDKVKLTSSATLWNQPRAQRFDSLGGEMLAMASAQVGYTLADGFEPYVGVDLKTPGWVVGDPYTNRSMTGWLGLVWRQ